jgi:hypothetical protein
MDFDALYTRAGVMDMGHCEHAVNFKQQAIGEMLADGRVR